MLTWRPRALQGEGEKVGTDLRVLAQVIRHQGGSLSPFAAWLENATAARSFGRSRLLMMRRLPKCISGLPDWKLLLPAQMGLGSCGGRYHLPVGVGKEEMPRCLSQHEHAVGATESHQAGQPLLQS